MNPMTDENEADVQVMLAKLLEIYDVKTLVAHLNGVGENRWSPAIFKRVVANETWHRLSDRELIHLNTLLPKPPAHHPHYAFRFIDLLPVLAAFVAALKRLAGSACLPVSGTSMRCAPIKRITTAIRSSTALMKIFVISHSAIMTGE